MSPLFIMSTFLTTVYLRVLHNTSTSKWMGKDRISVYIQYVKPESPMFVNIFQKMKTKNDVWHKKTFWANSCWHNILPLLHWIALQVAFWCTYDVRITFFRLNNDRVVQHLCLSCIFSVCLSCCTILLCRLFVAVTDKIFFIFHRKLQGNHMGSFSTTFMRNDEELFIF